MKLQNIVFPSKDFSPVKEAHIRIIGPTDFRVSSDQINCACGAKLHFDTYFNGFSISKWKKYTNINNLFLKVTIKGSFLLVLRNEYRRNGKNIIESDVPHVISAETPTEFSFEFPSSYEEGICCFSLVSQEDDSTFYGGGYHTDVDTDGIKDIKFALNICTYKREKYVLRNMNLIRSQILENEESELNDKIEVFIADNGQSLDLGEGFSDKIHVFPNKNAGGAGGFARGMIEIMHSANFENFSHIIMMDDDIVFSYETLYRTYTFLKLIKPEYDNAFIGAAMLKSNEPHIQSEAMDIWKGTSHAPVKYNYDTRELKMVLKNEIEDDANYLGWWYCAMPIGVVKKNNLPLPIFIKRDDIEYGLRNGETLITLNGLCVLHEAFDVKRVPFLDYYYWRNQCIINAIHCPWYGEKHILKQMAEKKLYYGLRYSYKQAILCFRAVEDFLRGIDWLKSTDVVALHADIMQSTDKVVPVKDLKVNFAHGLYERSLREKPFGRKKDLFRKLTLNGWVLPSRGTAIVSTNNAPSYKFYRVKRVINYDESSNKAFLTKKSYRELFCMLSAYNRLKKNIRKNYAKVKNEYRLRYPELINLDFWKKYLDENAPLSAPEPSYTLLDKKSKPRYFFKELKLFFKTTIGKIIQVFLCFLPIKKNRITFYAHERKGYTCNPKYVAEYIKNNYPDKFEMIWVSKFPTTCTEAIERGFKVVEFNTFEHWKMNFTSKVLVTNDCQPAGFLIRPRQLTINTWHAGMNYKKIGYSSLNRNGMIAKINYKNRNRQPKVYLSGSEFFTEDTSKSFNYKKSIFKPTGIPRNDILFRKNKELTLAIKERYGVNKDDKILLYAPTFRADFKAESFELDFNAVINALETKFGGNWKVFYRKHYFVRAAHATNLRKVFDVSDYDDMNELMVASDALVSDYSSCMWDFTFTQKPVFVYATDIEQYKIKDRSFAYPIEKWPYPIATNNQEMVENILEFDKYDYEQRVIEHHKDAIAYDKGNACEKTTDIILKACYPKMFKTNKKGK